MRWWLAVATCALFAQQARGESTVDVPVAWKPFTPKDKTMLGRVAQVPGAEIKKVTQAGGARVVTITYADGTYCASNTMVRTDGPIALSCGSADRYYLLLDLGAEAVLSWHGSAVAGRK